jgi:polysaccharide biosynthesis/export protein
MTAGQRILTLIALVLVCSTHPKAVQSRSAENYVIGPRDVVLISVFDQPTLSGRYAVEADGTFTFPHLGLIRAGGLTSRALEEMLRKRLSETLFRDPQVTVGVETYKSKRIFIMGEVRSPGQQPLSGSMTLIEALAGAGGTTPSASGDAIIVRPKGGPGGAPVLPGQDQTADILQVDLTKLQAGDFSQNRPLQDGDTVFVPRAETIYIFGEVKSPGAYAITKQMTVLQALSLAGGQTENGALNRIKIVRIQAGRKVEVKVKSPETELVKAGDTIIVPEKWF